MRLLNVKRVTKAQVEEKWKMPLPKKWFDGDYTYIRCNGKGEVKWDSAPIYLMKELEERGNYTIHV